MKLLFLADTHTQHMQVEIKEPVDYLIFAGDGEFDRLNRIIGFNNWLQELKDDNLIKEAIVICGNHDLYPQSKKKEVKRLFTAAKYLENDSIKLSNGMKLYGSPYTSIFMDWGFMLSDKELEENWKKIPKDCDILVTHGPAYGYLDFDNRNGNLGCKHLSAAIQKIKPKIHAFGHIHRDVGQRRILETETTKFINCGVLDNWYNMIWEPIIVEV